MRFLLPTSQLRLCGQRNAGIDVIVCGCVCVFENMSIDALDTIDRVYTSYSHPRC